MNKQKKINIIIIGAVVILVVGFSAGIAGNLFSRFYLGNLTLLQDLQIATQNRLGQKDVIIQEANRVIVEQDTRVDQVYEQTQNAVFGVYPVQPPSEIPITQAYIPSQRIAMAVAVTSDGWLVSRFAGNYRAQDIVVVRGGEVYEAQEIVRDEETDLVFINTAAENLQVLEFASRGQVVGGQSVIVHDPLLQQVRSTGIADTSHYAVNSKTDLINDIETYKERIILSDDLSDAYEGAPVFNLNNEIVGIAASDDVVPGQYVSFLLKSLLSSGEFVYPYMGINYIELGRVDGVQSELDEGALVTSGLGGRAVALDSPLVDSIQSGDVIVQVEGIPVNDKNSFKELIYDFRIGNTISFDVVRDGEQFSVEYTLNPMD